MYVVLRGGATFQLDEEQLDARAGTLVFVRPGTKRGAIAAENDTAVLAVGAKPGVVFEPSPWEDVYEAISHAQQGDVDRARNLIQAAIERKPDAWQGFYNAACIEARYGDPEAAFAHLRQAADLEPELVPTYARDDSDFDSVRDDPRFLAIAREPASAGPEA
jgi:tetratricopeptide (TPR) repeat protein